MSIFVPSSIGLFMYLPGAMLETSQQLLTKGFHPANISDSLLHFASKAVEVLESMAIPVDLSDNASLLKSANTSLSSKVCKGHSHL